MSRTKSFLKPISIDHAQRAHACRHDKAHRLARGDIRLRLKVEMSQQYFCKECSVASLEADKKRINTLLTQLREG